MSALGRRVEMQHVIPFLDTSLLMVAWATASAARNAVKELDGSMPISLRKSVIESAKRAKYVTDKLCDVYEADDSTAHTALAKWIRIANAADTSE